MTVAGGGEAAAVRGGLASRTVSRDDRSMPLAAPLRRSTDA